MTTALTDRAAARYRREHTARAQHRSYGALTALATLIAAAGVTAAIGSAIPVAHADTNDGKFLAALKSESITDHISPQHAIEAGHMVCQKLNGGATPTQVANDVLNSSTMPAYHSGFFVGASIKEYCPQYVP